MTLTDVGDDPSSGDTSAADSTQPPPPPARSRSRMLLVVLGAAVAVVLGFLVVALLDQRSRGDDLQAGADQRRAVTAAAGGAAEALLTYDYEDIDGTLERIQSFTGGDFADTFEEIFTTVQVPVITDLEAKATAEVQAVYVTEIDSEGTARAVVVIDQTVQSTAGTRRLTSAYLQMELVQRGDRWVVEKVPVNLSAQGETLTPSGDVAPTTTTTVPAG